MTLTDRNRRISRYYATGDDFWDALEELDDDIDDGFRINATEKPVWIVAERKPRDHSWWWIAAAFAVWCVLVARVWMSWE